MLYKNTDTAGRLGEVVGFRPLDYWDWGFKSCWRCGCLSLVFVSAVYVCFFNFVWFRNRNNDLA